MAYLYQNDYLTDFNTLQNLFSPNLTSVSNLDVGLDMFEGAGTPLHFDILTNFYSSAVNFQAGGTVFADVLGDVNTAGTITVNSQVTDTLEISNDQDWFAVTLTAGETYDISLTGLTSETGLSDPLVRILSSAGVELATNDDIITGSVTDSLLTFTVTTTGTYYISAESYNGTSTGDYTLSLYETHGTSSDVAADNTTTATAIVNGSVSGTLSTGDADWFAITLEAGQRYIINQNGTGDDALEDSLLILLDANGNTLATNDDIGSGNANSRLAFTADTTGTYYIAAGSYNDASDGNYAITVVETESLYERTLDGIAHFITDEFSTRSSYASSSITYNITGLGAERQALAIRALEAWAEVADLTFTAVTTGGQIEFTDDINITDSNTTGENANNASTTDGNGNILSSALNVSSNWNDERSEVDSYTYQTFLHEIGHALGLGHAGAYNGNAAYGVDNSYVNDSWAFSIMSYFSQNESGYFGSYRFVLGPQIADIIAIQDLYGVNTTTRNGDTVYGFNSTEAVTDVHNFSNFTRAPGLSIYDMGGIDTLDFSGYTQVQIINLNAESFSNVNGIAGIISIARGVIIENAVGGSNVDTIIGNAVDNILTGNGGNDILNGGDGTDYAVYSGNSLADYTITENTDGSFTVAHNNGGADGTDTLTNIEFLRINGTDHALTQGEHFFYESADTYTASNGNDTLYALGGNDVVHGAAGNDIIHGGSGGDQLFGDSGNDQINGGDFVALTSEQAQVYRLYGATLNREPDAAGLADWASQLAAGATLESITSGFINSTEFQAIYGSLNDTDFVTLLYNNVLNRAPDAGGLADWLGRLSTGSSRESVVNGFSESVEYSNNTDFMATVFAQDTFDYSVHLGQVYRLYGATLDRAPDEAGFLDWVETLDGGDSLESITSGFINSTEFQAIYGSLNDTDFVTLLYNNVLNRAPDAGGLADWLNRLSTGSSRESVVNGFSESVEYQTNTTDGFRTFIQTITIWSNTIDGGVGDDIMIGGRGHDTFTFYADEDGSNTLYGLQTWDTLSFDGFGYKVMADILAHITQNGDDAVFTDQGVTITFLDTNLSIFNADMFAFSNDISVSQSSASTETKDTSDIAQNPVDFDNIIDQLAQFTPDSALLSHEAIETPYSYDFPTEDDDGYFNYDLGGFL